MTHEQEYLNNLMGNGYDVTVTVITGDICPCMVSRDANISEYSAVWHELNPAPGNEHCNGTGLINRTSTVTSVKSFITNELESMESYLTQKLMTEIGEKHSSYVMMLGCAVAGAKFDLSILNRKNATFTYKSNDYKLIHHFDLDCCQVGLLKQMD